MNYLAHAYLSFDDPEVLTGNMISDFVKGKLKYSYPVRILRGIDLHRDIDAFTDNHPVNRIASRVFRQAYGRYAGAFLDVAYDHFLAVQISRDGDSEFEAYTRDVYAQIATYHHLLPGTFRDIFPYMVEHNWLYNYQFSFGIRKSFEGLAHRARYLSEGTTAFNIFEQNYNALEDAFSVFFPELATFAVRKISDIH